jgi:hypothetical protein
MGGNNKHRKGQEGNVEGPGQDVGYRRGNKQEVQCLLGCAVCEHKHVLRKHPGQVEAEPETAAW